MKSTRRSTDHVLTQVLTAHREDCRIQARDMLQPLAAVMD